MGRIKLTHLFLILFGLVLLPVGYMNCSRPLDFTTDEKKFASANGGDGYSGKIYVTLNDGGACSDGSPYSAQIKFASNLAYLVRENCAAVDPQLIDVLVSSVDNNSLSFGLRAFRSDASIGTAPRVPATLAAMGMTSSTSSNHVCVGQDCWKFETDGALSSAVEFVSSGDHDITVMARADLALGVGARMELTIDGVSAGSQMVSSSSDAEYGFRVNVAAGRHQVAVVYTNDYRDTASGADRNLYAVSVRIAPVGSVASACLARPSGSLLTLTTAQTPYFDKNLAAETRVDARSVNYTGTVTNPIRLGGGSDSCLSGGFVTGGWPLSTSSSTVSDTWGMGVFGPNFLVEKLRVENYGNCVGLLENASGFNLRGVYCTQIRGDFISNKDSFGGTIEDSLFDGGISFFNDKDLAAASNGAVATIRNNLVRLQRFDQTYWGTPGHGWFWKQDSSASAVKLRLHGNVFMAEEAPLTGSQWLTPSTIASCKKADGSPDNTIVWLGAGPYPNKAELDTGCFTLTTDRSVWDRAASDWKTRHGY